MLFKLSFMLLKTLIFCLLLMPLSLPLCLRCKILIQCGNLDLFLVVQWFISVFQKDLQIGETLPAIISWNQSALIEGRKIIDNVLMAAQELVCGYHRPHLSPRCALKIDLRKAFDTLD